MKTKKAETAKKPIPPEDDSSEIDELMAGLVLSEDRLTEAALEQPILFAKAAKWRIEAVRRLALNEGRMKSLKAEKSLQFRQKADADGEKVTEAGITARVDSDEDVATLAKKLRNATVDEEYSNLIIQAYRARANSIRVIADLKQTEMYHGQKVSYQADMEEAREKVRKKFPGAKHKDDD